jgi:hypothetical protein
LTPGGTASDFHGGSGTDTVHFEAFVDPLNVSLDDQANDGFSGAGYNVHSDVENVVGGSDHDVLTGSGAPNRLDGGDGNDQIDGAGGADTILGRAGADTILARDGTADSVDCGADSDTATIDTIDTAAGCESTEASAALVDADTDGSYATVDCDESNPAVHPGAADVPGNGIDEDCDGADAAAPPAGGGTGAPPPGQSTAPPGRLATIAATIQSAFKAGLRTLVLKLVVKGAPPPASIRVTCNGKNKGCPFKAKTLAAKSLDTVLTKLFKKAKLRPGVVIEVRVTKADAIGKVFRFTIRKKKAPAKQTLCLATGAKAPSACS